MSARRRLKRCASPVSSPGRPQAADEAVRGGGEARLAGDAAGDVEELPLHAEAIQHARVVAGRVELRLLAKELQRAAGALVVGDAGRAPQITQAVAAVLGQREHPALVALERLLGAVRQHVGEPAVETAVEQRPEDQRPVAHREPFEAP